MKKLLHVAIALCFVFLVACSSSQTKQEKLITEVKAFIEEAEQQQKSMTVDEWKNKSAEMGKRFKELGIEGLKSEDFSVDQKLELASYALRWAAISFEASGAISQDVDFDKLGEKIEERSKELEEAMDKEADDVVNSMDSLENKK